MKVIELIKTWNTVRGVVNIVDRYDMEDSLFYGDLNKAKKSSYGNMEVIAWNSEDDDERYLEIIV